MGGKQSGKNRAHSVGTETEEATPHEKKETAKGPVPQSAFVIGGDEEDDEDDLAVGNTPQGAISNQTG